MEVVLQFLQQLQRNVQWPRQLSPFGGNCFIHSNNSLPILPMLQSKLAKALQKALEQLGVQENNELDDDEEHLNILNRNQVIQWACMFGNELCRKLTTERLDSISSISLDLRDTVLCGGLRAANGVIWLNIYEQSLTEEDPALKSSLTRAVACIEDDDLMNWYFITITNRL